MGGARALIASLGASISLVSAALSLLFVSFFFAYHGLAGGNDSVPGAPLVVDGVDGQSRVGSPGGDGGSPGAQTVVIRTAASPRPAHDVVRRSPASTELHSASAGVETRRPIPSATSVTHLGPASAPRAADPAASTPATGDSVRDLGDDLTTTVGDTGGAAGNITAPLGPPVSQAVQDALNIVQEVLKAATDKLAGTLDKTRPR